MNIQASVRTGANNRGRFPAGSRISTAVDPREIRRVTIVAGSAVHEVVAEELDVGVFGQIRGNRQTWLREHEGVKDARGAIVAQVEFRFDGLAGIAAAVHFREKVGCEIPFGKVAVHGRRAGGGLGGWGGTARIRAGGGARYGVGQSAVAAGIVRRSIPTRTGDDRCFFIFRRAGPIGVLVGANEIIIYRLDAELVENRAKALVDCRRPLPFNVDARSVGRKATGPGDRVDAAGDAAGRNGVCQAA